jgi:hypothetical protein
MSEEEVKLTEKQKADFTAALQYMKTAKLILKDLEDNKKEMILFKKYTKQDIIKWLEAPENNEKQLRKASIYLYNASSHYRRLINYFAKMAIFAYIVVPYKLDTENVDIKKFKTKYKNVLSRLENMNLKHELLKVMTTVFREDVFYGYEYETKDSYVINKLPPDYCQINSNEDGIYTYAFDFQYFNTRKDKLEAWGDEFKLKYAIYEKNPKKRWQEIDSKNSICIKLNEDIEYPIAPFIGLLPMIYDIEDYKMLTKASEEIGNYKLLSLLIPLTDEGDYKFPYEEAVKFYNMMNGVLPDNIGLALSPMQIDEHSFEKTGTTNNINRVAEAETNFWSAGGVSELLFNSQKSSSATIGNSIKSDEEIVYAVLRQIERWLNRKLKQESGNYKFKVQFLDVTLYSRKDYLDFLLKNGQYGMPVINAICACLGYSPADTDAMTFLENEVLQYHYRLVPLQSSHTQGTTSTGDVGAPKVSDDELSEAGVQTRENDNRINE